MTSKLLIEHLTIVLCAICIAIVAGLFLGVIAYLFPKARKVILNLADLLQTIPSLAMLGLIMIVIGAGKQTVIIGLALYSLLPIIRNTVLGLTEVSRIENPDFTIVYLGDGVSDFQLELTWLKDRKEPYNLGENEFHTAFAVKDMKAALAKHKDMGCVVYQNPAMGIYFIVDPDGYWLEIIPEVSFLVIVVIMIYALKKVSEYSRRRMMVLIWTAMFMFLMLVIDVISETGIGAGYSSLFTIFDLVNVIVLFIAIRALIIPVESCPDIECNFSSEEERIQELEFKNKIMMTYIGGIQDELETLINYMKVLEVTQNKDRAHVAYLIESDSEVEKSILKYRDEMNNVIASVQEKGAPVNYKELVDKMNKFKEAEEKKIDDAYRQKFKEMGYDDDEIDAEMSSGEDNSEQ